MEMYAFHARQKGKICGYIFHFIQNIAFWHNHICSRSKDVFAKEGNILMVCGVYLFS